MSLSSILARVEAQGFHMQVYFTGIRLAPSKDMSQDDVQKWVKEMKAHNDMMVS